MVILNNKESILIAGGVNVNGTFLNAFSRALKTLYDIGYALGASLKRAFSKSYCVLLVITSI